MIGKDVYLHDIVQTTVQENLLDESTRDFNYDLFYGDDINNEILVSSLNALPMMAERRIVVIKRSESLSTTMQKYLLEYVKNPSAETVLVLIYFGEGKGAWIKNISADTRVIECKTPRGRELEGWIKEYISTFDVTISDEALDMITSFKDLSLADLSSEIDKGILLAGDKREIDLDILQQVWGISNEINIWQFFDRIAAGKRIDSLNDLSSLGDDLQNDKGIGFIISQVSRRLRLAWKEKTYDQRRVAFNDRKWTGRTSFTWKMASKDLKDLPKEYAEKFINELVEFDRSRKTRALDAFYRLENMLHSNSNLLERGH